MTDFVAALARKWADAYTDSGPELLLVDALVAAIREALEEAEKVLERYLLDKCKNYHRARKPENRNCANYSCGDIDRALTEIAALREGR